MSSSQPSVPELRGVCQPAELLTRRSAEHWAGRAYMRRVSIYVTWLAVRARLSANAVTWLMVAAGVGAAAAYAVRGLGWAIAGFFLVQVYLLLDCVDGEVARWRRTAGPVGIYLDRLGHYVVEAGLLVALGARAGGWDDPGWLSWGLGGALAVVLVKAETDQVDLARVKHGLAPAADEATVAMPRASLLARARRLAGLVPLHRLIGAVESSLVILGAAIADRARGGLGVTRGATVGLAAVGGAVFVGHLVMILASKRLRP